MSNDKYDLSEAECEDDMYSYYHGDWMDELEYEHDDYSEEREHYIKMSRKQRERELTGKFVVVVNSRYNKNQILYLQDRTCGTGYWTKFRSNAMGYNDESTAKSRLKTLRFNNPKVMLVLASGKLKEVS